jgi:alpha-glucosidase
MSFIKTIHIKIKISLIFVFTLSLSSGLIYSQVSSGIGEFQSISQRQNQVIISTENAQVKLTKFKNNIVRIQISHDTVFDDFSYALIAESDNTGLKMEQGDNFLLFKTEELTIKLNKNQFYFSFLNSEGKVLNEDVKFSGIRFYEDKTFVYKRTFPGETFLGLGEKTGPLNKAGRSYTNWNTDAPAYGIYEDPLYISIPFYIGIHDSLVYGIYLDNSYRTNFSFGAMEDNPGYFSCEGGEMDYFFISGKNVAEIVSSYTDLTGRMEMPSLWSLGLHQSRWSYYPDAEVLNIARTYREKKFPADAMTLDIHYMDDYKLFTWNEKYFPQPTEMISQLRNLGFHTTLILDPGIKIEKDYHAFESGLKNNIFVKSPGEKKLYQTQVWPGWCYFPDFTNPLARAWWGNQIKSLADQGVRGFWNDMNEPADWSKMFDPLSEHDFEGIKSTHLRGHNVYGMQMARASYEGAVNSMNERPFLLTRAGFSGIQRYSAVWTGDNVSTDEHMMLGVRLINNIGIGGIAFCGMDIPGFSGGDQLNNELYARFVSIGAFSPFYRIHAAKNTRAQEPWNFGEWVEDVAKKYTEIRYQLLPYIYSSFYESTQSGLPVQRSLSLFSSFDPMVYDQSYENQYFFGQSILVAPVISTQDYTKVYFPDDGYYDFFTDKFYPHKGEFIVESTNTKPESKLPVFIKSGAIIPMQSVVQTTAEKPSDTLFIHIYNGERENSFLYYEDDGTSFEYRNEIYYKRKITFNPAGNSIIFSAPEGKMKSGFKYLKLILHGFSHFPENISINKESYKTYSSHGKYILTIPNVNEAFTIKIKQ